MGWDGLQTEPQARPSMVRTLVSQVRHRGRVAGMPGRAPAGVRSKRWTVWPPVGGALETIDSSTSGDPRPRLEEEKAAREL